jgi:hypothetical protein
MCLASLAAAAQWKPMFNGKSLEGWKATPFTGAGQVRIEDGAIVLSAGEPMTGVNFTNTFPKTGYELKFTAMRRAGNDFFAGVTLPFGDSFFTWVLGGWGGDIVGISSIDGWDASENETRSYFNFDNDKWYSMRIQVTGERIQAWIDDQRVVDVKIGGRAISLRRGEIKLSAPVGFASYRTTGAVRNIEYRLLTR